ncbi:MAG TPA: MFS transporter [Polyangiaceae bacterium]|jgi:putative MFS transporter|nr:MFS transporter [Polyangiaceae bacterium]
MSAGLPSSAKQTATKASPLSGYQRRLLAFLSVASFFEGYDFFALTQILPNLRADLQVGITGGGLLVGFINVGTILAFVLARKADRWGRKPVLTATIAGYTVFTFLSGLAPNVYVFALLQMIARVFLIAEWATSMVIAAEEFPARNRGTSLGVVSAAAGFGAIVCAGVVPMLLKTSYGWRSVYFVSIVPLVLLAIARSGLKETSRFSEQKSEPEEESLFAIWGTDHRQRVVRLAVIWFLTYVCTQNAVTFWKEFAVAERGLSDAQVGNAVKLSALASMPLAFAAGKLLDVVGRKVGATLIYAATIGGVIGAYTAHGVGALTVSLVFAVLGVNSVLTVLNAFTTELFPTRYRGSAFAWSNNVIGRIGYCLSPVAVGALIPRFGWGMTLAATTAFPLLALILIWITLPETRGRELEETASL